MRMNALECPNTLLTKYICCQLNVGWWSCKVHHICDLVSSIFLTERSQTVIETCCLFSPTPQIFGTNCDFFLKIINRLCWFSYIYFYICVCYVLKYGWIKRSRTNTANAMLKTLKCKKYSHKIQVKYVLSDLAKLNMRPRICWWCFHNLPVVM